MMVWIIAVVIIIILYNDTNKGEQVDNRTEKKIITDIQSNYGVLIAGNAARFGLDIYLIYAIICQESKGKNDLPKGKYGEIGLMQITPPARNQFNETFGGSIKENDLKEPATNILVGCGYLTYCFKYFKNNIKNFELAVKAYNAGPIGAVKGNADSYYLKVMNWYKKVREAIT